VFEQLNISAYYYCLTDNKASNITYLSIT